ITQRITPKHFITITIMKGGRTTQICDRNQAICYVVSSSSAPLTTMTDNAKQLSQIDWRFPGWIVCSTSSRLEPWKQHARLMTMDGGRPLGPSQRTGNTAR